jgi:hypothetical protein
MDEGVPEMVERVARAISAERWNRPSQFDMESESWRDAHRDMARAAIVAMLEPTAAMMNGFRIASSDEWRAAIDAALGMQADGRGG